MNTPLWMASWTLWRLLWTHSALRRIVEFRISPEVQACVGYLAKRANDGELTPDEDAEYEALIDGADLITILKLKAQRLLAA